MRQHVKLICIFIAVCASSCLAQTVTVRVINGKNGHPLVKQEVIVSLLYDKGERPPANYSTQLNLVTDKNGEAHFGLPEPAPAHLSASVRIDVSRWRCTCILLDSTNNIVRIGVITSKSRDKNVTPQPGEILFVAQPLSLFYRLLGPLEKY